MSQQAAASSHARHFADPPKFTGVDKPGPQDPDAEPYNSYRFNAHRWDQGSGTYDMGFRNYDPGLNRFLTRDMYGGALADMGLATDPFTMNRYAFGGGNPISNIEYNGHFGWKDLGNGLAGAATSVTDTLALAGPAAPIEMAGWFGVGPGLSGDFQNRLQQGGVDTDSGAFKTGFWATEIASIAFEGAGALKMGGKLAARGGARLIAKLAGNGGDEAATVARQIVDDVASASKGSASADSIPAKGGTAAKTGSGAAAPARSVRGPSKAANACRKPNSFVPGTGVLMADGTHKDIEDVQIGDQVTATDPETGDTRPRKVTDTITGQGDKSLVTITIDTDGKHGDKTADITATDEHPFWLPDYGRWTDAEDLKPGMWLRTNTGTWIQITAVTTGTRNQRVHNLTVFGDHTYYVGAGGTSVLVHNCDGDVHWVAENASMSSAARAYDAGAAGSQSGVAPALQYYKAGGSNLSQVKFDGYDAVNGVMIDRKLAVTTFNKAFRQAQNQSLALEQNGLTGVWEVPNAAQAARARSILGQQLVMNIKVRIVVP
ncbi:polymorphic toxin-type HINT domain-containing protein [Spirillospora sp. NPDC048823]|uniref:polymorphic toxin-type HINT domain-containing protein n=1 Tax=unclassified Spirillospora TaxID=2642701 RepID=UPI0037194F5C